MPEAQIEGKVVQILNEREIVVNVGADRGVKRGMKFAILASEPLEIRDVDTNEILGMLDREKVRVRATEVQPKMTICETYETRSTRGSSMLSIAEYLNPRREIPQTLNAEEVPAPLTFQESYVKRGDRAREVVEEVSESRASG